MKIPDLAMRQSMTCRPEGRSPVMYQRWAHLLFLHWSVEPDVIQATLPPGLQVDTHDGKAWLGIVPFFMQGLRPRFLPAVPGLSNFPELNLRTYVHDEQGRPGVWFYSLDAHQRIAVAIARTFFSLPYIYSRMEAKIGPEGWIAFNSLRPGTEQQAFRYRAGRDLHTAEPGSLEFFLVERYVLFSYRPRDKQLFMGRIHHRPYPLTHPEVAASSRDLFSLNGFRDPGHPAEHVLMSPGVDVTVYGLEKVG
ncbi:MAG: YqjF family protein [Puniceicoccaceae bacterium]